MKVGAPEALTCLKLAPERRPLEIRALAGQIPPEWVNPATPPERITAYLIQARKNLPALLKLVEHTLLRP
jgi:hypothetical protein